MFTGNWRSPAFHSHKSDAMTKAYSLSEKAVKQLDASVRAVNAMLQNPQLAPRARWQKGGGGSMIWARNDGALGPASSFVVGISGTATLYELSSGGILSLGTETETYKRRDTVGTIDNGVPIILAYVSGELTLIWAERVCPAVEEPVT